MHEKRKKNDILPDGFKFWCRIINNEAASPPACIRCLDSINKCSHPFTYIMLRDGSTYNPCDGECMIPRIKYKKRVKRILHKKHNPFIARYRKINKLTLQELVISSLYKYNQVWSQMITNCISCKLRLCICFINHFYVDWAQLRGNLKLSLHPKAQNWKHPKVLFLFHFYSFRGSAHIYLT